MRTCQSCGLQNPPDRDFCECGEYLRWEPTGYVQAITPEMAAQAAAEAAAPAQEPAAQAPAPAAAAPPAAPQQPAAPPEPVVTQRPAEPAAPAHGPGNGNGSGLTTGDPLGGSSATAPPPPPPAPPQPPAAPAPKTAVQQAVPVPPAPPAQPTPAAPEEPETARITLRRADREADNEHTLALSVEPGQRDRVLALVRNQGSIVDNYQLKVEGMPEDWWSIYPDTVYLVPFGTGGTYEQEVEIHIHPPRSPEAEAKLWELRVVAHSKAQGRPAASAPMGLVIEPYTETSTTIRPQRAKGRRKAHYDVAVENKANAPVLVALEGEDQDDELDFGFNRPPQEIPPGKTVESGMQVRPPKQIWIGRATEHRFTVSTLTGERVSQGVFKQKAWLPWWMVPVAIALAALAVLLYLLLPKNVVVPDVVGSKSTFEAEKELTEAGFKLAGAPKEKVDPKAPAGSVIGQTPAAGEKAEKGEQVTVQIAVGDGTARVPKITGLTLEQAEKRLRRRHLTIGQTSPTPPDPKGRIKSQIPADNEVVKEGAPVDIFFALTRAEDERDGGPSGGADPPGGDRPPAGTPVKIPEIAGRSPKAYAQLVASLGLLPRTTLVFNSAKPGTLVATKPGAGTEVGADGKVELQVSAGPPILTYDDDADVLTADALRGTSLGAAAGGPGAERDPAISADGRHLAYQSDGRVFLTRTRDPAAAPRALTPVHEEFSDLAFAPSAAADVLALLRDGASKTQFCLGRLTPRAFEPHCVDAPAGIQLDRTITWAPDGRRVLIFGMNPTTGEIGMVLYRSRVAFSSDIQHWTTSGFATDVTKPGVGVIDASFSPDGTRLAVVTNFDEPTRTFRVWVTDADDLHLAKARRLPVIGCKTVWRPDGKELVVVRSDLCHALKTGELLSVPLDEPRARRSLELSGDNPVFAPLTARP